MGKTRDLFKKTRYQGNISCRDGQKWYEPNRNGMNLIEAEEIKRWQEYTEELYKKVLNDLYNQDGVITHLEPDNLEWELKWALGSITMNKASGVVEFQLSYFKS